MKYLYVLFLSMLSSFINSQTAFSFYTTNAECNGQEVVQTEQLDIYQTTNGLADGPRDSTFCYSIDGKNLDLLSFDDSASIFVRVTDLTNALADVAYTGLSLEELDQLCYQEETMVSMHFSVLEDSIISTKVVELDSVEYSLCNILWGSESRTIVDWYYEITPVITLPNPLPFVIVANQFESAPLDNLITVDEYRDNRQAWIYSPESIFYPYITAVIANHCDSVSGVCYTELIPAVDTGLAEIVIPRRSATLIYEDFAGLRGAPVAGSMDLRHTVTVEESEFGCLQSVELHIDDGVYSFVSSGTKGFLDGGCIMMNGDSEVRLAEGVVLTYGTRGMGILGMSGHTVVSLAKQSELVVDGQIMLSSKAADRSSEIHLSKDSKLIFTSNSSIRSFRDDHEKITVYVHDGEVDLSSASDDVKQKLHLIYDESPTISRPGEVIVAPNPVRDYATIHADVAITSYQVIDMSGRVVVESEAGLAKSVDINLSACSNGLYIARCVMQDGSILLTRVMVVD